MKPATAKKGDEGVNHCVKKGGAINNRGRYKKRHRGGVVAGERGGARGQQRRNEDDWVGG